jgi:flagellar biosynthesis protein FlhF
MRLKWYRGRQLPEIMRDVRNDLGDEAVILHTRTAQRGLRGLLGRASVEVLAAVDEPDSPGAPLARVPIEGLEAPVMPEPSLEPFSRGFGADTAALTAEVAELRSLLIRLGAGRALPASLASFYSGLLGTGVDEETAFGVLDGLATVDDDGRALAVEEIGRHVEERLAALIGVAGCSTSPREGVVAFVGTAGAGKTATAAKLAVRAQVAAGRARLVSLDGLSLGTTGYLDALASASGLTSALAVTPQHVASVMGRRWSGLTVIDTPGVSPRDPDGIAALAELLRVAAPREVHLVVPATAKPEDALAAARGLAPLGPTHLAVTRLDEASTCGSLVTVCARAGLPLSYLAAGRDIPNDLHAATARDLVRRVLQGEPYA